ncbi:MAG: hypothetical protein NTU87_07275 [Verrucomicrobia bacterium]|nr:hypothetical protein [Verrucomicrobiota bacterium]
MQASVEEKKEPKDADPKKRVKGAAGGFLSRYKMLFGGSLAVAIAVHLLLLIGFGSYTLFKGSSPRMPFTSEGGVPAEDVGMEAPPENAPDMVEETSNESSPAPSDAAPAEMDTVLAVSGVISPATSFQAAPPVLAAPASTGIEKRLSQPGARSGAKASSVNFFGAQGQGTNVYFVVDVSDSMVEADKGGIDGYRNLKTKLGQMIASLAAETNFNVVFYGDGVDLFRGESVPATPENRKAAEDFLQGYMSSTSQRGNRTRNFKPKLDTLPSTGGTSRMDLGLLAAFEGRADTIFVLTDGKPVIQRAMNEKEREEYRKKAADSEISVADRQKYEKEVAEYRKKYEEYNEEMKKYREKYADKITEKARREAENRAKGKGKVIEGQGFVVDSVKISGLPDAPKAPTAPLPPQAKAQGKAVAAPNLGNWQDEDILEYLKETIAKTYKKDGFDLPSIHGVSFMSKTAEEKFLSKLASRNNGKFIRISAPIK